MKNLDIYKSIRKEWAIKPTTQVKRSDKVYKRNKYKQDLRKTLKDV